MEYSIFFLFFITGMVVGGSTTWLSQRMKGRHSYEKAKSEFGVQLATLTERLQGRENELLGSKNTVKDKESQILGLQAANLNLRTKQSEIETKLEEEQKAAAEKIALINEAQQKLSDTFKALSADALSGSNQSFLTLAQTTFEKLQDRAKSDLGKREQAINELVKPIYNTLIEFDTKLQELEKARIGAYASLHEQVHSLHTTQDQLRLETSNLVSALRKPAVRGRWGEIQLKRVVELAGMLDHCDFSEQESTMTEEGRIRPDLLVHLPGRKTIVVDAKAPLEAYLDAIQTDDENLRKSKLKDHARQIRNHISSLAKKSYWNQYQSSSPEFVVLFIPGEAFFSAALEQDPALIELGVEEHVILATPTTLIALLKAVVYGWKQENIARNAQEISALGRELYKRIAVMSDHWRKVGKSLGNAIESYNQATGSLESRVLVTARKFKDLEATAEDDIEELPPIDRIPREIQIPEVAEALTL
jgi:DNA recombination protein RmuC